MLCLCLFCLDNGHLISQEWNHETLRQGLLDVGVLDVVNCLQVKFRLARPGLMKDFAGMWRVQPYTSDAIGALSGSGQADAQSSNPWHSLTSTLNSCAHLSFA
jgi:hypothetical protein